MSETVVKMDPELKAQWVDALRSGKYKQGKGRLRFGDCYCCLGVLCEVAGLESTEAKYSPGSFDFFYRGDKVGGSLPYQFTELAGTLCEFNLARMNDDGRSFNEIADYIEENL